MTKVQIAALQKQAKEAARKANEQMRDMLYLRQRNVAIY